MNDISPVPYARHDLNHRPTVLAISKSAGGAEWEFFYDLECPDFNVKYCHSLDCVKNIAESERVHAVGSIVFDATVSNEGLASYLRFCAQDPFLSELSPIILRDLSFNKAVEELTGIGKFRMMDVSSPITAVRAEVSRTLEEFRTLIALRRDLHLRTSAIGQIVSGSFELRTREEGQCLATFLSLACEDPVPVAVGLTELLVNAVEHGNLEIGSTLKGQMIEEGTLIDEVNSRLEDPQFRDRRVRVQFSRSANEIRYEISDEGPGFDHHEVKGEDSPATDLKHGRGILMARNCFDSLMYLERGNRVVATKSV